MPKVYNKRTGDAPPSAIYVGRPSKWGNPYRMTPTRDRTAAIEYFRQHLAASPQLMADAKAELRGKDLVCWCAPLPCHADVLLEVANAPDGDCGCGK